MRPALLLMIVPLLAGCHVKVATDDKQDGKTVTKSVTVTTADGTTKSTSIVSGGDHGFGIDTDKFKMALDIPGLNLSGGNLDIDGMKLFPGSSVHGMKVNAHEDSDDHEKNSKVVVSFTAPASPAAVLDHAVKEAEGAGWKVVRTGNALSGTKDGDSFAYALTPSGDKTDGTLTILDTK